MLIGEGTAAVRTDHHRYLESHSDPEATYPTCKEFLGFLP